ncbi:DgyrCDS2297 [Dimorphilus gyrociliatus]|uniref:DgyrCDS2297 n=1 Tax=Dimorphilus gyrociliatus TaxID=2664684 RepID=A0A7I8VBN9_9ANNE|nr:DgyrCDS2297 [Dimorphilus gyrociliatus]
MAGEKTPNPHSSELPYGVVVAGFVCASLMYCLCFCCCAFNSWKRCRTRRNNGNPNVFTVTMQNSLNTGQVAIIQSQNSLKRKIIDGFLKNFTGDGKKKQEKQIRVPLEVATCPICCEDYKDGNLEILIALLSSCGHFYHFDCIWSWLVERSIGSGECSCPLCRTNVEFNVADKKVGLRVFKLEDVIRSRDECKGKYSSIKRSRQASGKANYAFEAETEEKNRTLTGPGCTDSSSITPQRLKRDARDIEWVKDYQNSVNTTASKICSEKTCHICKRNFSGDPSNVIVGYIIECGHFYHYDCILNEKNGKCPRCVDFDGDENVPGFQDYEILTAILADILEERQRTVLSACSVCNKEFDREIEEVLLGLIEGCGHYYHIECLKTLRQCPQCVIASGEESAVNLEDGDYSIILLSDICSI